MFQILFLKLCTINVATICHGCGLRCATSRNDFGPYLFVTGTDRAGRNDDTVRDGVRILIYRVGGHALASPEGGGSCSLGTHYLLSLSALGLPIT